MTELEQIEYVNEGHPYRTSDGKVFQNFSELSLCNGFWWFDTGCAIAPKGCEQNLPIIDNGPKWSEGKRPKGVYFASGFKKENKMLIDEMKSKKITAMKNKNVIEKNILSFVIGKIQTAEATQNKKFSDEQVESMIRKEITNIDEELSFLKEGDDRRQKLVSEKEILNEFLPVVLSQEEIEAFLLNSDGPEIEQIQNAVKDGAAVGIVIKACKANNLKVLGKDVEAVVTKLRSNFNEKIE